MRAGRGVSGLPGDTIILKLGKEREVEGYKDSLKQFDVFATRGNGTLRCHESKKKNQGENGVRGVREGDVKEPEKIIVGGIIQSV